MWIISKGKEEVNMSLKVSIITSVWNNEATIEDAIKSVLSQNYSDIEYSSRWSIKGWNSKYHQKI